jgi:hypothetical protein
MPSWFQRLRKRQAGRNERLATQKDAAEAVARGSSLIDAIVRVEFLDGQLALAVAQDNRARALQIIAELQPAMVELENIKQRDAQETQRAVERATRRINALVSEGKKDN